MFKSFIHRAKTYVQLVHIKYSSNELKKLTKLPDFIIATKNGLYYLKNGQLKLIDFGQYYGVTITGKKIIAYKQLQNKGQIVSFELNSTKKNKSKEIKLDNLPKGCHQIDHFESNLYITNTYDNSILKYDLESFILVDEFFPLGTLNNGRKSNNYAHINSIFRGNEFWYLFCHNETQKTKRKSTILKLNAQFEIIEIIDSLASNGHNIIEYKKNLFYCNSTSNEVLMNEKVIFQVDLFTRGLSITKDFIVFGGSEYAIRELRSRATGKIYINKNYETVDLRIPGMVQEIRCVSELDYGLSDINSKEIAFSKK